MKYGTRIEFDSRRLIRGRPADAVKFLDAITFTTANAVTKVCVILSEQSNLLNFTI